MRERLYGRGAVRGCLAGKAFLQGTLRFYILMYNNLFNLCRFFMSGERRSCWDRGMGSELGEKTLLRHHCRPGPLKNTDTISTVKLTNKN